MTDWLQAFIMVTGLRPEPAAAVRDSLIQRHTCHAVQKNTRISGSDRMLSVLALTCVYARTPGWRGRFGWRKTRKANCAAAAPSPAPAAAATAPAAAAPAAAAPEAAQLGDDEQREAAGAGEVHVEADGAQQRVDGVARDGGLGRAVVTAASRVAERADGVVVLVGVRDVLGGPVDGQQPADDGVDDAVAVARAKGERRVGRAAGLVAGLGGGGRPLRGSRMMRRF